MLSAVIAVGPHGCNQGLCRIAPPLPSPRLARRKARACERRKERTMNTLQDDIRDLPVSHVMQREVLAVEGDWSLEQLAGFLVDNRISGAPVTGNEGELIGVVSLTDIVRESSMPNNAAGREEAHDVYLYALERQMGQEELRLFHTQYESAVQVRDVMTPMVFKVNENTSIREVADMMLRGGIHRVFVTDGNRLTGIVTALDMLRVIRDM
jgi:CBS domain-containing protein